MSLSAYQNDDGTWRVVRSWVSGFPSKVTEITVDGSTTRENAVAQVLRSERHAHPRRRKFRVAGRYYQRNGQPWPESAEDSP